MILGVGIDLVLVERIENLLTKFKEKFEKKIFTANEISAAKKFKISKKNISTKTLFYAKRFAAKEAFSKALGLGIGRGINFCDIEIENDKFGKPKIKILNSKEKFFKKYFNCKKIAIHLSLSDEKNLVTAIVIIEKIS